MRVDDDDENFEEEALCGPRTTTTCSEEDGIVTTVVVVTIVSVAEGDFFLALGSLIAQSPFLLSLSLSGKLRLRDFLSLCLVVWGVFFSLHACE